MVFGRKKFYIHVNGTELETPVDAIGAQNETKFTLYLTDAQSRSERTYRTTKPCIHYSYINP